MPKESYFSHYESPNIVINTTDTKQYSSTPKRPKLETTQQSIQLPEPDLSFLNDFDIDKIVECLNNCEYDDSIEQNKDLNSISNKEVIDSQSLIHNENNSKISENFIEKCTTELAKERKEIILDNVDSETMNIKINIVIQQSKEAVVVSKQREILEVTNKIKEKNENHNNIDNIEADRVSIVKCSHENVSQEIKDTKDEIETLIVENKNTEQFVEYNKTKEIENKDISTIEKGKCDDVKQSETKKSEDVIQTASPRNIVQCPNDMWICNKLEKYMFQILKTRNTVDSITHYGKHCRILKCLDPVGKPFAVKVLRNNTYFQNLKQHNNLMKLQADKTKEDLFSVYLLNSFVIAGHWCFVMEFYDKNLKQELEISKKPFHIDTVQNLARQLVAAVAQLRKKDIIHSDIKPNHILLNDSKTNLKLCGFDRCFNANKYMISPLLGSPGYRPPEVILGYSIGFSIDVWTTALILHEMATLNKLFSSYFNNDILFKQMSILGNIPYEMLIRSPYASFYFNNGVIIGTSRRDNRVYNFHKTDKIMTTVKCAYYNYWASSKTSSEKRADLFKINSFLRLLDQMLVICPKYRISIEKVSSHPFIFKRT